MRVLVVGGYGVFGSRVAERLARDESLHVIVAGRSAARAAEKAADLRNGARATISHAAIDAARYDPDLLRGLAAAVVINASGPFQRHSYALARACIAARCHYVDLADAREFVTGIAALDAVAKAAGVLVVSGASTVPALSAAVLDHYQAKLGSIARVSYGVSPGNSFDPGHATTASILSYVGRPFVMPRSGKPHRVHGWQGLRRHRFPMIGRRWMGWCDIPDLDLFPARYPGLSTIRFAAGTEVGLFHLGMWALSWLVRSGVVARPERLAHPLLAMKRRLDVLGSDRGGMFMAIEGGSEVDAAHRIDWHLIAGSGHGPYIPATPSVIVAKKLCGGKLAQRGAMPCLGLFSLADFADEVADLDIHAYASDEPLYCRLLGRRFAALAPMVRQLHDLDVSARWTGRASVARGTSWPARAIGRIARLPSAGDGVPLEVTFTAQDDAEIWSRKFGDAIFRSVQRGDGPVLRETVGPARLTMRPLVQDRRLALELTGFHVLGLPVPRRLWPSIATREWEEDGRYRFEVEAGLPYIGRLVHYRGWLERETPEMSRGSQDAANVTRR